MKILAVDPGGTTGWASWSDGEVTWGQLPGATIGARALTGHYGLDALIIERYTIGERTVKFSRQDDALRITGGLEWWAVELEIPVIKQMPRDAKRLFTDDRLRQMGWWARGEEHARDALRHLGFYLAKKRLIKLIRTDGAQA